MLFDEQGWSLATGQNLDVSNEQPYSHETTRFNHEHDGYNKEEDGMCVAEHQNEHARKHWQHLKLKEILDFQGNWPLNCCGFTKSYFQATVEKWMQIKRVTNKTVHASLYQ